MDATIAMLVQALELMGVGVALVFAVLALFYFLIRLMVRVFPFKGEAE